MSRSSCSTSLSVSCCFCHRGSLASRAATLWHSSAERTALDDFEHTDLHLVRQPRSGAEEHARVEPSVGAVRCLECGCGATIDEGRIDRLTTGKAGHHLGRGTAQAAIDDGDL